MTRASSALPEVMSGDAAAASSGLRDAELVQRARRKDREAEELLYRAHVQSVGALATRLLGRSSEAEDVVQDAFVTAFARLHQLRDERSFRAWLMRITLHEVHRRYRRRKLLRVLGLDRGQEDATFERLASPGTTSEQRAELAMLDRAVSRLPARERLVWMLRHVEGEELAEIASACAASLASVKRWLARAEARIRAHAAGEVLHG